MNSHSILIRVILFAGLILLAGKPAPAQVAIPPKIGNTDLEITTADVGSWSEDWCKQAINSRIDRRTQLFEQIQQRERLQAGQAPDQIYVRVKQFGEPRRVPMTRAELRRKVEAAQRIKAEDYIRLNSKAQKAIREGKATKEALVQRLVDKRTAELLRRYEQEHRGNLAFLKDDIVQAEKDYERLDRQIVVLEYRIAEIEGDTPKPEKELPPGQTICPVCGKPAVVIGGVCSECSKNPP